MDVWERKGKMIHATYLVSLSFVYLSVQMSRQTLEDTLGSF